MNYCTNCGNKLKENSNFCTSCGKPTKNELEKIKAKKQEEKEKRKDKTILWLGTLLVIVASIIFAFTNWENMERVFKIVFLIVESLIFFIISFVYKKLNNESSCKVMWFLGTIFIPIILNLVAEYELFGNYLSYSGSGIFVYLALSSFICTVMYYLSYKFIKSNVFLYLGHIFLYLVIVFTLYAFKLDIVLENNNLILIILSFINLIIIVLNIFIKNRSINIFMSFIMLVLFFITIIYFGISYYDSTTIFLLFTYIFEIASLFILIKVSKKNFIIYLYPIFIYLLSTQAITQLNFYNLQVYILILVSILLYLILRSINNKAINIISFILLLIISYSSLINANANIILSCSIILLGLYIFIIKCNIGRVESSISEILLPVNIYLIISSLFDLFVSVKPELILLISSIICFTIFNIFDEKNKKDNLNKVFEISAYILVLISSFIIILFKSTLTSFMLNEFLWIYYFLYAFIKKKKKAESISMFSISIANLILCSISLDIKLYYVILTISTILTVIYILSNRIGFKNKNLLIYFSYSFIILLSLFNIKEYSMFAFMCNILLYVILYYIYNKREKIPFIFKYIFTLLGFILIYRLFDYFIDKEVIANLFTLITYIIIIISMYLLEIDSDRKITCYIPVIAIPYINLVNNVDIFSDIKIELIAMLIILLTMIIFEKIRPFKDTKLDDIFEVIVLIIIYLSIAQETITFNYIVSALYLFYGIIKKKDIFVTLGIVLILLSTLINLIQAFSTLATIFVILVIGISLIGYVLYKETIKNKN